ncbi:MAG TPA: HEAT repeat domain-containing protein [bacterium]|nr:HEAT repeat domain-containing protein [bacterium]HRV04010.1 HEAT repeat domain-containing protein [Candidatus Ratteibacteria bacterium]
MLEKLKLLTLDIHLKSICSLFLVIMFSCSISGLYGETYKEILINGTTKQKIETLKKIISGKNTRALPDIIVGLDDPSDEVRILISEALLNLGDGSFVTSYQKEITDSNWQVRLNGIKSMVKWASGDEITFDLKRALDDTYWQVRYWAAIGIGKFGDETMIEVILSHLKDENLQVRAELFWSLKRILSRDEARYAFKKLPDSSISTIKEATNIDDVPTIINAIWALEASTDPRVVPILLDFLKSSSDDVKIQTVWAIENLKSNEGFEFLRAKMLEPSMKLKIETIKTLVRLDDKEGVPALIERLEDPNENVRIFALWALKEFNDFISYPAIVKRFMDKSEKVKDYAYNVVLSLKSPDFIPILEDVILSKEFSLESKVMSADLLGKIGTSEESLFFDSVKNNPDPLLRKTILSSWYRVNPDDSAFLTYLNFASRLDSDRSVRTNAQNILREVIAGIRKDIKSEKELKRSQAIERLSFIKESPLVITLVKEMLYSKYPDVYGAALELIPYQPKSAVFSAMKAILENEESTEIKKLAILGMGKARLSQAVPLLLSCLKSDDPEIQIYAAYSLACVGNNSGLRIAMRDIRSSDVQIQSMAVETLAILNTSTAIPELLRILENSELEVKLKAAWALSRLGEEKGLYTLVNLSRQDIEPLRTQARHYLSDSKIPLSLRRKIPEIQRKQETLLTGVPETSLKKLIAQKILEPPVIDGNENDRCWKSITEDRSMVYVIDEKVPSEVQTSIMAAYDDKNIYFLFICMDPQASSITFDSRDFLTICLNPQSSDTRWYQYTLHPTNFLKFSYVWKKYLTDDSDTQWESQWQTATKITDTKWVAEILIPLRDFNSGEIASNKWEINFQRVSDHLPAVTWTGRIDNPLQFGQILFKTSN